MKTLYLIGGTMGVGKTTVCQILKRQLPQSVFLDGDWCWDAHPFTVTAETKAMVTDNICHTLNNFLHCSAYENILLAWVMHEQDIIDSILSRLDTEECRVLCISLTASEETLTRRLEADIAAGARKPDVLARSLSHLPLYEKLNTIKIRTDGKAPSQVAEEIKCLTS